MVDISEWVGLFAVAVVIGGFFGLVLSRGSVLWMLVGAGILIVAMIVYRLVILDRYVEIHPI